MKAIDLFAGLGGFTEGARQVGVPVLWAANHWRLAVDVHAINHREVECVCQDLQQADWSHVPNCDLVLASPCCQGHTKARGKDRPHHDKSRSTAWAVVSCCEYLRPKAFIVENVKDFLNWKLYPAWKLAMTAMGYHLTTQMLDASDLGVPQERSRLFIVGTLFGGVRIPPGTQSKIPIAPHINWEYPKWSMIRDRVPATQSRAANGRAKYGDRFVMPYYGSGSGLTGRELSRPLGTVTCKDRWAVVDGERMRMLQIPEYKAAMGFSEDYHTAGTRENQINLLGNAVCPAVAAHAIQHVVESIA